MNRQNFLRGFLPVAGGIFVACALFLIMMTMISSHDAGLEDAGERASVNFIRFDRDQQETRTRDRREPPEEPEPPDEPPPPPEDAASVVDQPQASMPRMDIPNIDVPTNIDGGPYLGDYAAGGGSGMGGIDTEAVATVRVPPNYPRRARQAKLEGYVTMEFTIRPDGSVSDIEVVDSEPGRIFDEAAVHALSRWRFEAKSVGGEKVARRARQTIRFNLE